MNINSNHRLWPFTTSVSQAVSVWNSNVDWRRFAIKSPQRLKSWRSISIPPITNQQIINENPVIEQTRSQSAPNLSVTSSSKRRSNDEQTAKSSIYHLSGRTESGSISSFSFRLSSGMDFTKDCEDRHCCLTLTDSSEYLKRCNRPLQLGQQRSSDWDYATIDDVDRPIQGWKAHQTIYGNAESNNPITPDETLSQFTELVSANESLHFESIKHFSDQYMNIIDRQCSLTSPSSWQQISGELNERFNNFSNNSKARQNDQRSISHIPMTFPIRVNRLNYYQNHPYIHRRNYDKSLSNSNLRTFSLHDKFGSTSSISRTPASAHSLLSRFDWRFYPRAYDFGDSNDVHNKVNSIQGERTKEILNDHQEKFQHVQYQRENCIDRITVESPVNMNIFSQEYRGFRSESICPSEKEGNQCYAKVLTVHDKIDQLNNITQSFQEDQAEMESFPLNTFFYGDWDLTTNDPYNCETAHERNRPNIKNTNISNQNRINQNDCLTDRREQQFIDEINGRMSSHSELSDIWNYEPSLRNSIHLSNRNSKIECDDQILNQFHKENQIHTTHDCFESSLLTYMSHCCLASPQSSLTETRNNEVGTVIIPSSHEKIIDGKDKHQESNTNFSTHIAINTQRSGIERPRSQDGRMITLPSQKIKKVKRIKLLSSNRLSKPQSLSSTSLLSDQVKTAEKRRRRFKGGGTKPQLESVCETVIECSTLSQLYLSCRTAESITSNNTNHSSMITSPKRFIKFNKQTEGIQSDDHAPIDCDSFRDGPSHPCLSTAIQGSHLSSALLENDEKFKWDIPHSNQHRAFSTSVYQEVSSTNAAVADSIMMRPSTQMSFPWESHISSNRICNQTSFKLVDEIQSTRHQSLSINSDGNNRTNPRYGTSSLGQSTSTSVKVPNESRSYFSDGLSFSAERLRPATNYRSVESSAPFPLRSKIEYLDNSPLTHRFNSPVRSIYATVSNIPSYYQPTSPHLHKFTQSSSPRIPFKGKAFIWLYSTKFTIS